MTKWSRGAVLAFAAGIAVQSFGGRVVTRTDFDVGETWKAKKVAGREFFPMLSADGHEWVGYGREAPFSVYRKCGRLYSTRPLKGTSTLVRAQEAGKKGYAALSSVTNDRPYRLYDIIAKRQNKAFADTFYSQDETNRPLFIVMGGARPAFLLDEKYPLADRADFAKWRAAHPNFIGFDIMGEFDSDSQEYFINFGKTEDIAALQRLEKAYPCTYWDYACDVQMETTWMKTAYARCVEYCFGCTDGWSLPSGEPGMIPLYARLGVNGLRYEATTQGGAAKWTLGGAYLRGAARQWDVPYGWYTANFYTGCRRGDTKLVSGENSFIGLSKAYPFFGPHRGASFQIIDRQNAYGWLIGATSVEPENWGWYHKEKRADGSVVPTRAAEDFQRLFELSERVDRGVPYTPYALMLPVFSRVGNAGSVHNFASLRETAALSTLVPGYPVENHRLQGLEGGFYNSEFGEGWDIVVNPESNPQAMGLTARQKGKLSSYKAIVAVGLFDDGRGVPWGLYHGVLSRYAREGGTAFVTPDMIRRGTVLASDAGVDFATKGRFIAGRFLIDENGKRTELTEPYVVQEGTPTSAKVLWTDEKGVPLAYANDLGKGRIVTVCVDGLMPEGLDGVYGIPRHQEYDKLARKLNRGELKCDLMAAIFRRIQRETMPFEVTGDIQWGVNFVEGKREKEKGKSRGRWLLWMFNNKGITNYLDEEPVVDHACDATVVVKGANGVTVSSVREIRSDKPVAASADGFTVTVPAGGWTAHVIDVK